MSRVASFLTNVGTQERRLVAFHQPDQHLGDFERLVLVAILREHMVEHGVVEIVHRKLEPRDRAVLVVSRIAENSEK